MSVDQVAAEGGYPELGLDGWLRCESCAARYPVIAGTPRMLAQTDESRLAQEYPEAAIGLAAEPGTASVALSVRARTAKSFAYEWEHFGSPRSEWRKNFLDYMRPHAVESLRGKLILDVGTGSGRHSAQAAQVGARVVAVDLGQSIDVARGNVPADVLTVQADAEELPFAPATFDIVMSIGVLHHLSDTAGAIRGLVPLVRPGGHLHLYLYWQPEIGWHRAVLRLVSAMRRVTVRMPFWLLHLLCYPLAAALWTGVVIPYRTFRSRPRTRRLAAALPLKTYADYPFGVLVNDQFDRFSAPIEQRFTREEARAFLSAAGLEDIHVIANHGWVVDGRRPGGVGPGEIPG